jgi:hypothetical protein
MKASWFEAVLLAGIVLLVAMAVASKVMLEAAAKVIGQ